MKKHTKIYLKSFRLAPGDLIVSELSGSVANDIHHIISRGMGGSKYLDRIENLMALTRREHEVYGDKKQHMVGLFKSHKEYLISRNVEFDEKWIDEQIERYSIH